MHWSPKPYMLTALCELLGSKKVGLFEDPGLGKTAQSLAAIMMLTLAKEMHGVLIIAPKNVCFNTWPREIEKWSNFNKITYTILHSDVDGVKESRLWGPQKNIYLINPGGLKWLYKALHAKVKADKAAGRKLTAPFDTRWVDESTLFKNPEGSKRFEIMVNMTPVFKRFVIMTGTPAPKSLLNLWSQIYLLDQGESLGNNYNKFKHKYFYPDGYNQYLWHLKDGAREKIYKKIAHLILDMSADEYLDMPDLIYNQIPIELSKKEMNSYKEMERQYLLVLDDKTASADQACTAGMKCQQIANGKVYEDPPFDRKAFPELWNKFKKTRKTLFVHKKKAEALEQIVDELNGKPLLVAYWFKHDLATIREVLGDIPFIGSGTTQAQLNENEREWNLGNIPVMAGMPMSMGHGLNLQEKCNDVFWYSMTWDLELWIQFIDRVWRNGVSGAVRVHIPLCNRTIDRVMMARLLAREEFQTDFRKCLGDYRKTLSR